MKKPIFARMLSVLLLGALTFLLCACPGGGPIEPPAPCTHNYADGKCTLCGADDPNASEGGVTPPPGGEDMIFGEGNKIEGAGDALAADAAVLAPASYDESAATTVPAGNFTRGALKKMSATAVYRADGATNVLGTNAQNATYDGQGGTILLPDGLFISEADRLTFKNMTIVGDLTVAGKNVVFEGCKIIGTVTVKKSAQGVAFNNCRAEGGFSIAGDDVSILNCYVKFAENGVNATGNSLTVQNCRFEGTGTAVTVSGEDCAVKYSTLTLSEQDTGIAFEKGTVNGFAVMNLITGAQKSILANEVFNTVAVRNTAISVYGTASKNLYVCDNSLGGRVVMKGNDYLLCDGNTYPADDLNHVAIQENNQNVNGDSLMDVDARPEVGADEALLPHVNRDQFVGMERKKAVKDGENELDLYNYITGVATKEKYVFVAPGAYAVDRPCYIKKDQSDTVIYAYGVYAEAQSGYTTHLYVDTAEDVTVKGITVGYKRQSCGQVYVLEVMTGGRVRCITGAGMVNDFSYTNEGLFVASAVGFQRAGDFYALTDSHILGATHDKSDGTIIINLNRDLSDIIAPGDLLTCRLSAADVTVLTAYASNIYYKDITAYGVAAAGCFMERQNKTAVTYYRAADTTRSGEIIDKATYERYEALENQYGIDLEISIDEQNNFRGSPAHIGSIDATHVIRCAQGSQIISSLFENMCDDGTNQKGNHARLYQVQDNGDGTTTLVYKPNFARCNYSAYGVGYNYKNGLCSPFAVGERVYVYNASGALYCDTPALSVTTQVGTKKSTVVGNSTEMVLYAVTVSTDALIPSALVGYDLNDDSWADEGKVLVDNMSQASNGFLFDNMLIQNVRSRGLLIKSSDGVIKNCTFRNIAKLAVSLLYELYYGESGVTQNVVITRNLIDNVGFGLSEVGMYYHYPIGVQGLGGTIVDETHLLCRDIEISYNKIINTVRKPFTHIGDDDPNNYAVYLRSVMNVRIFGNDFGNIVDDGAGEAPYGGIRLQGAMNIEIFDNIYGDNTPVTLFVAGDHYKNVYGADVVFDGVPQFPDKEN